MTPAEQLGAILGKVGTLRETGHTCIAAKRFFCPGAEDRRAQLGVRGVKREPFS